MPLATKATRPLPPATLVVEEIAIFVATHSGGVAEWQAFMAPVVAGLNGTVPETVVVVKVEAYDPITMISSVDDTRFGPSICWHPHCNPGYGLPRRNCRVGRSDGAHGHAHGQTADVSAVDGNGTTAPLAGCPGKGTNLGTNYYQVLLVLLSRNERRTSAERAPAPRTLRPRAMTCVLG